MRKFMALFIAMLISFSSFSVLANEKYNVKSSDENVSSQQLHRMIINKKLKFGMRYVNYVIRKGGVLEDRYGNVSTQYTWGIAKGGVFCRLDRKKKNWGACFKAVKSNGNLVFASPEKRYRVWIKDAK